MTMLPQGERAFQPGQVAQAQLTIINDGDLPTQYVVEVSPGAMSLLGFVGEGTIVFITEVVNPGRSLSINFPLSLPAAISEGSKMVRVRIGDAGPAGEMVSLLDEQLFGGRLRVELAGPPAPPPAPPPTEAIPLPDEPILPEVADLSATFTPPEVTIGEVATGTLNWLPQGTEAFTFGVRVDLVDSAGGVVMNMVRANPTATMGARQATLLTVDTTGLSSGWYGLEVTFTDLATGAEILRRTLVGVLLLLEPPPPPPELPDSLSPGDLTLATPTVTPNMVAPGGDIAIRVPFTNVGQVAAPVYINTFIMDSRGNLALVVPQDIVATEMGLEITRSYTLAIPTDMPGGSYGVLVVVVDVNTGKSIIDQTFPNLLTVVAPEVAPPPPPPTPTPTPPTPPPPPPEPPAPTGSIDSLTVQGSVDLGGPLWVRVAWRSSVPAYVAADLMEPPDFTGYKSAASTEMRAAGSYSDELRIPVDPGNAEGDNSLRVSVASEDGVILDRRITTVTVVSPEF